jgi:predicted esterase
MTPRLRRIIIIVFIQLLFLALIVFFPESEKDRRFGIEVSPPRRVVRMETTSTGDTVLDAMNDADLFDRYRFTRAVGVEAPGTALLILPDAKYAEYWHMEALLCEIQKAGMGALILDLKDAGEFIPLRSEEGVLRTTEERYTLFADAAGKWLKSLGFRDVVLLSFGNGAAAAWDLISRSPGDFSAWVDISGFFGFLKNRGRENLPEGSLPSYLFFSAALDPRLSETRKAVKLLSSSGASGNLSIIPDTGRGLRDSRGQLDPGLESSLRRSLLDWCLKITGQLYQAE